MLDLKDIRNQSFMDSDALDTGVAAEMARAESWAPHVEDGLDAFARVVHAAEAEKWSRVIAAAGSSDAYRQRLAADPAQAVREFGISVPPGVELKLVENSETVRHMILPAPAAGCMPEAELNALADSLAYVTGKSRLPQCWADTWVATRPLDPGMPQPKPADIPGNKPK